MIAEDVLLLLFDPASGVIAGEETLYYVLAGAVLTELALDGRIGIDGRRVRSLDAGPPADPLLRSAWDRVAEKPRDVQTVLAMIGPNLRGPVLDRLVERGDIRRERRKVLGLFRATVLRDGGSTRRAGLLARVRAVLVDGVPPEPRIAAIGALLSASGKLVSFHRDIPWTSPVIARAKELEQGDWGADAAGAAVTRTTTATIIGSLVASSALPGAGR